VIAYLNGKIVEKKDSSVVVDTQGVGYEVFCSPNTMARLSDVGGSCQLYVHTQYRADGAALFGFVTTQEKSLFLSLIKVDSVGPKSALNIMAAAPWDELIHHIEDGDVSALSKLPKISKKTAEHLVVKLKGKLTEILLESGGEPTKPRTELRQKLKQMRGEAQTALSHLGFRTQDVERALDDLDEEIWNGDLQEVIRHALNDLSGNN
jgi:holliday junction DNA helicase RuvA